MPLQVVEQALPSKPYERAWPLWVGLLLFDHLLLLLHLQRSLVFWVERSTQREEQLMWVALWRQVLLLEALHWLLAVQLEV